MSTLRQQRGILWGSAALLGLFLVFAVVFSACKSDSDSVTGPGLTASGSGSESASSPQTTNNPSPAPAPTPEPKEADKPDGRIFKPGRGKLSVRGTNDTNGAIIVALACYTPAGPNGQFIKGTFSNDRVPKGHDFELAAIDEPLCDYQCDVWFDVPPGTRADNADVGPNFQEQEFIDAKFGGDPKASSCFPPPPPCPNPPCRPPESCDDLFSVRTETSDTRVWVDLIDKSGNVIAQKHFERREEGYVGEICSDDGIPRSTELSRASNDEPCCFPVKIPPLECDREQLEIDAKRACEVLGVKSLDFESCTWECNPPVCDVGELETQARNRKQRCENAGGTYEFRIDENKCELVDDCIIPPLCDVGALEAEARQNKQRCENAGGTYSFTINERECKLRDECKIPPPECIPPNETTFQADRSIGNHEAECRFFGNGVPADNGADWYVTKCGLFYQVTHGPFPNQTCENGQDVSHSNPCQCDPDDDSSD